MAEEVERVNALLRELRLERILRGTEEARRLGNRPEDIDSLDDPELPYPTRPKGVDTADKRMSPDHQG